VAAREWLRPPDPAENESRVAAALRKKNDSADGSIISRQAQHRYRDSDVRASAKHKERLARMVSGALHSGVVLDISQCPPGALERLRDAFPDDPVIHQATRLAEPQKSRFLAYALPVALPGRRAVDLVLAALANDYGELRAAVAAVTAGAIGAGARAVLWEPKLDDSPEARAFVDELERHCARSWPVRGSA
jgi:hypothetical protein